MRAGPVDPGLTGRWLRGVKPLNPQGWTTGAPTRPSPPCWTNWSATTTSRRAGGASCGSPTAIWGGHATAAHAKRPVLPVCLTMARVRNMIELVKRSATQISITDNPAVQDREESRNRDPGPPDCR
eukprot:9473855-Pyramimonas_sp.AAC.1